jgi:hypothetical protein
MSTISPYSTIAVPLKNPLNLDLIYNLYVDLRIMLSVKLVVMKTSWKKHGIATDISKCQ